jgi:hypothetical protein
LSGIILTLEVLSLNHHGFLEQDVFVRVEDNVFEKERSVGDHLQGLVVISRGDDLSSLVHIINDEVGNKEDADEAESNNDSLLAVSFRVQKSFRPLLHFFIVFLGLVNIFVFLFVLFFPK